MTETQSSNYLRFLDIKMFSISEVSKLATNRIVSKVTETATALTLFHKEVCRDCGKSLSVGQYTGISYGRSYTTCVVCNSKFCNDCIHKSICPVPDSMWHPDIAKTDDMTGCVCREHGRKAVTIYIIEQSKAWCDKNDARIHNFINGVAVEDITKPSIFSQSGVGYRLTMLATTVASYAGYDRYVKLIKYAMMGKAVLALLLDNNVLGLLAPLMPLLKDFNVASPQDMLTLYYLGCNSELQRKLSPNGEHMGHFQGDIGVLECGEPQPVESAQTDAHADTDRSGGLLAQYLDILSTYAAPAQWLYSSVLPRPHDGIEWSTWYFSRVIAHEGWTLLASHCKSQKLPDATPVPAFALVAREGLPVSGGGARREAILVIRGSKSPTDWQINIHSSTTRLMYRAGPRGETCVADSVHTGMLVAARAILDVFGMRRSVHKLLSHGYDVKVVGHSLGAGVAVLVVAELKNGFYRRQLLLRQWRREGVAGEGAGEERGQKGEAVEAIDVDAEESLNETKFLHLGLDYENVWLAGDGGGDDRGGGCDLLPSVISVGFGSPPCVGEQLSTALRLDGLVVTMVHRDDIIPRISSQNLKQLADEVKHFAPQGAAWMREDQRRLERYARTIGREGVMGGEGGDQSSLVEGGALPPQTAKDDCKEALLDPPTEGKGGEEGGVADPYEEVAHEDEKADGGLAYDPPLVVAGAIVHLTKSSGSYRATLCDHSLPCLRRIDLYRNAVDDHHMSSHIRSIRMLKMVYDPSSTISAPPTWQPVFDPPTQTWARCSVCRSDPTWPYITNGVACRALVYHHCRACGKVVCVMCAPAGDYIPDVGVGNYQQLKDFRIPIPSLGLLMPERVCLPCYLHCHQK